ncbi:MAG: RpiB/LacA/LacB family sugar-phosphate isomerase [Candidatus Korobacteraceae bacterium]
MHIAIGSDEASHAAKERIAVKLVEAGHEVMDANAAVQPPGSADYAEQVAMLVLRHNAERGIIITSRVVGASVAANRVPGIRAAACHDAYSACIGAKAEGMNVLVLALHLLEQDHAQEVVDAYLGATLAPVEVVGGLPPRRLQRVFAHVRENIAQELAVADMAQVVGMSQYYFSKLFKLSTGTTPHQYVMRQRVERAQEILRGGRTPLAEVATHVGFETQSHFTSVFRRLSGVTPKHYREMHQTPAPIDALAQEQDEAARQKSATAA